MSETKRLPSLGVLAALCAVVPEAAKVIDSVLPPPGSRRNRIHDLHDRTGWQLSVCRRLVDSKSAEEIEALVRAAAEKGAPSP